MRLHYQENSQDATSTSKNPMHPPPPPPEPFEHLSGQGSEELGDVVSAVDEGFTEPVDRDELGVDLNKNVVGEHETEDTENENAVGGNEKAVGKNKDAVEENHMQSKNSKKFSSKKNRNIRGQIVTLKNKLETLQEKNGGVANFLLLVEDNFSEQHERGRKTDTNRKIIVTAGGPLREAFKKNTLKYDPENMMFLKKGKSLEHDHAFFDEYISERMKQVTSPVNSSPALNSNMAGSSTSLSPIVLDMLSRVSKRKKVKDSRKRKRKYDSSSSRSSSTSSEESSVKKSRNQKKKEKKNVMHEVSGVENLDSSESSEGEDDDDPTYGTSQRPNSKPKKRGPSRHPNDRKARQDILKAAPKKVLTPGSFNLEKRAPAKKGNAKKKTNMNQPSVHSPSLPDPSVESDAINTTMTGTRKVTQWMRKNSLLAKSGVNSKPVKNARKSIDLNQNASLLNPKAARKNQVTLTKDSVVVRKNPVVVTKDPVVVTKDPVVVTKDQVAVTKNPVTVTKGPEAVTKDPVTVKTGPEAVKKGLGTLTKDLVAVSKNLKTPGKKSNLPIIEKTKQAAPNKASCPSGQFKGSRGAKMREMAAENAPKKLMTDEEIEKFLVQTPTRKR